MSANPTYRIVVCRENAKEHVCLQLLDQIFNLVQHLDDVRDQQIETLIGQAADVLGAIDGHILDRVQQLLDDACAASRAHDQAVVDRCASALSFADLTCEQLDQVCAAHQSRMDRRERRRTMASDAAASAQPDHTAAIGAGKSPEQSASSGTGRTPGASIINMSSPWPPLPQEGELAGLVIPRGDTQPPIALENLPKSFWTPESEAGLFLSLEPTPVSRAMLHTVRCTGPEVSSAEPVYLNLLQDTDLGELSRLTASLGCMPGGVTAWSQREAWDKAVEIYGVPIVRLIWQHYGLSIPGPMDGIRVQPAPVPDQPDTTHGEPSGGTPGRTVPVRETFTSAPPPDQGDTEPVQLPPIFGGALGGGLNAGRLVGGIPTTAQVCAMVGQLVSYFGGDGSMVPICKTPAELARYLDSLTPQG